MSDTNVENQLRLANTELNKQIALLEKTRKELAVIKTIADEASEFSESIINTIREPLIAIDHDLRVVAASRSFYKVFNVKPEDTVGQMIYDLGNKQWDIPKLRELLETILPEMTTFDNYEVEHGFVDIGRRIMLLNARQIKRALGEEKIILVAIEDITERRQLEILLEESEKRYRRLFETANDGILLLEKREGEITQANPAITTMLGYSNEEFIGNSLKNVGFPDDVGAIQEILQTLEKDGILHYKDAQLQNKNGQTIDTDIYMVDKASLVQCNIRDATERKCKEVELRSAKSFLDSIINAIADPVFVKDDKRCFVLVNDALCAIVGRPREELVGEDGDDMFPEEEVAVFRKVDTGVLDTGEENVNEEFLTNLSTGEVRTIVTRKTRYIDPTGKRFLVGVISDITARKRIEDALKESENKYRLIAENMVDVISILDMNLRFTYVSPSITRVRGFTVQEAMKQTPEQLLTPESLQIIFRFFEEEMKIEASPTPDRNRTRILELEAYMKDGSTIWLENTFSFIRDEDQKPVGILSLARDITERKRAEEALLKREREQHQLVKSMINAFVIFESVFDDDGHFVSYRFIYINDAYERITGVKNEEVKGRTVHEVWPDTEPEWINRYGEVAVTGVSQRFDLYHDPTKKLYRCNVYRPWDKEDRFCVIFEDITERKRAEEKNIRLETQLQQSQKMEAIGTLAGGIAHDFNNILSAVLGYTELAISDVPQGSNVRDNLEEIYKAGNRAKDLVSQILAFSRQAETQFFQIQIHLIVKEAVKLLRASLPATIEINENIRAFGKVSADPTQIHQILMNLCTNASHAMTETGGELSVSLLRVKTIDDPSVPDNLSPGPYLKLTVSDTGCGMMPDVISRIFEPYFTTKGLGKGTGLGLSMVQGIVQSHGGLITVESTPGKGSRFHVYLPEITDPVKDNETVEQEKVIFKGTECILVVDDEPPIVQLLKKTLERMGYEVTGRTGGIEALELFKAKPDQFDLIITDMTMPHMTGYELARQLIEIRSDIPIILCSGFHEKVSEERTKEIGIRASVMKPILQNVLSQTIRKVLDGEE